MTSAFHILPIEIRSQIFKYCTKRDLVNLAVCCRFLQIEVAPILWRNVSVQCVNLSEGNINSRSHNLKNTRSLTFEVKETFDAFPKNSGSLKLRCFEAFNFGVLMRNCDPAQLTSLSIIGPVMPDVFRFVSEMVPMLKCLKLSQVADTSSFDFVSDFHNLESLSLYYCDVEDRHMKKICLSKELRTIEIEDCICLTYKSLVYISQVQLTQLKFLRSTWLHDTGRAMMDDTFFNLAERNFTNLEVLIISENEISDLSMAAISRFDKLRYLDFYNCPGISDKGVAFLSHLPNLRHLSLSSPCDDSEVTDEGIRHVSKMTSLTSLNVYRLDKMTDAALHMISQLQNLNVLDIGGIETITDRGFAAIENLKSLQHLSMEYLDVTNDSLQIVAKLRYLRVLKITYCCELTDDGLHHLSNLKRLRKIVCEEADGLTSDGFQKAGLGYAYTSTPL